MAELGILDSVQTCVQHALFYIRPIILCIMTFLSEILTIEFGILDSIQLPVVLYGCEAWTLTLREERRLRVLENRILSRIFGFKRDENGEWRKIHNEELHSLYRPPNIVRLIKSRRRRWAGHVA